MLFFVWISFLPPLPAGCRMCVSAGGALPPVRQNKQVEVAVGPKHPNPPELLFPCAISHGHKHTLVPTPGSLDIPDKKYNPSFSLLWWDRPPAPSYSSPAVSMGGQGWGRTREGLWQSYKCHSHPQLCCNYFTLRFHFLFQSCSTMTSIHVCNILWPFSSCVAPD